MFSKNECGIVSNLRLISRTNFILSQVEHEKSFITWWPDLQKDALPTALWSPAVDVAKEQTGKMGVGYLDSEFIKHLIK